MSTSASDTRASVRLHGLHAGWLSSAQDGRLAFAYDPAWLQPAAERIPLSFSMPKREEPYGHEVAGPFFDGLLPDNAATRNTLAVHLQVDASDDYALLRELGRECPGAVSVHPDEAPVVPEWNIDARYKIMSEAELAQHIRELPVRPLFIDADGEVRLSLAGVHHKAAIIETERNVALAIGRTPTTHILKIDIAGLPDSVRLEHYCLELARAVGIGAVRSRVSLAEDIPYLTVARYDRVRVQTADGVRLRRVHQEDFCQALSRFPRGKYEKDGGPGWSECFRLTTQLEDPATARPELLNRAIFQFLVGNPDAHAKNYSIIHRQAGARLSPLYDVNNAAAFRQHYKRQKPRLAMFIGGERDPDALEPSHWRDFGEEISIRPEIVMDRLRHLANEMSGQARAVRDVMRRTAAETAILDVAVEDIVGRCERVLGWSMAATPRIGR